MQSPLGRLEGEGARVLIYQGGDSAAPMNLRAAESTMKCGRTQAPGRLLGSFLDFLQFTARAVLPARR